MSSQQEVADLTTCDAGDVRREVVDNVIKQRFASRSFTQRPVSRQTVEDILEVARFAPSGANIQPWRPLRWHRGARPNCDKRSLGRGPRGQR